LMMRLL